MNLPIANAHGGCEIQHRADRDPWPPALDGLDVKPIAGKAGDLKVWDRLLAHGNGHNTSDKPRLARYIIPRRAEEDDEELRRLRIESWRERRPAESSGGGPGWPRDPCDWEHRTQSPAVSTDLGRKLLGLDEWE
ncbi:MAG: hypothetical protein OXG33_03965 [Chloroflexi bacterium]|nr:hypothetical protein [Chloroflexota bacterium]